MELDKVTIVDTHTEGEPTRIILGLEDLPGKNITEKRKYIMENLDWIRRTILMEPRGHKDQFGLILLNSSRKNVDYGLVYMDTSGYLDMCGHATMGVTTALINLGYVKPREPETIIKYETVAGIVEARAKVENGKVKEVAIIDVPSFYFGNYNVKIPELGYVNIDVAFGGNFFAIVNAREIGVKVRKEYIDELIDRGLKIRDIVNKCIEVSHPTELGIFSEIKLVMITDSPENPIAYNKNITIFGDGQFDRSPCGSGTAARLATLYFKGLIGKDEVFIHESILGTLFKAKIIGEVEVGSFRAIIPMIIGRAFVTQISKIIIDEEDPLKYGFII